MTEIQSLLTLTAFFLVAWLPGSIAKRDAYGRKWLLSNRDATNLPPLPAWGDRTNRAYENLKNYFPVFAVTILTLVLQGKTDAGIRWAAAGYVLCRISHFIFYTGGNVTGRATAWIISMLLNVYLIFRAF